MRKTILIPTTAKSLRAHLQRRRDEKDHRRREKEGANRYSICRTFGTQLFYCLETVKKFTEKIGCPEAVAAFYLKLSSALIARHKIAVFILNFVLL